MKRRWYLKAAASDQTDHLAVAFVKEINSHPERFWLKRSALQAVYFYEHMFAMPVRFYAVKDDANVNFHEDSTVHGVPSYPDKAQALEFYNWLRSYNPHLPNADTVVAGPGIRVEMGPEQVGTISLTVYVNIPTIPKGSDGVVDITEHDND